MMVALTLLMLVCAVVPAMLFCINLRLYVEPPVVSAALPAVSILIPARNEAGAIGAALRGALSSRDIDFEVVVMDDGSTDGTGAIVLAMAAKDSRIRLEQAPALPAGWNGKQHACWALANTARNPVLCFVDADVTLGPECVPRMAQFLEFGNKGLVSGFPRQVTGTFLEWMLLPLIHFVLLGFLPIAKMREGTNPAFAAGCGQFMLAKREDYFACGGHSNIKLTMHDGLRLPRLFRAAGFRTDLADITNLASCRMYTSGAQVWSGLAKNATEGIADPKRIVPISLVLILGQVLPWTIAFYLFYATFITLARILLHHSYIVGISSWALALTWLICLPVALIASSLPRWLGVGRFRQDWRSALLHPIGILLLLAVQWYALVRKVLNRPITWRSRAYTE